jgi:hypothetical protein
MNITLWILQGPAVGKNATASSTLSLAAPEIAVQMNASLGAGEAAQESNAIPTPIP